VQADLRRGKAGTSPQHRIKSSIHYMAKPRISDDRALKVVPLLAGEAHCVSKSISVADIPDYRETG